VQRYNPKEIEPKWQQQWEADKVYQAVDFDKRPKFVMLTEFPYPSGAGIHIGHTREYTLGDIIARHKRMQGHNVLYPMGYDAFGLPTENYAIKNKISPQKATDDNVATFQSQLESLGLGIDWSRSFRTSDPEYYKWTQWLFLQFFKAGLAYQDEIAINWCPFCKTGLANEEVANGRHERCDTLVEKKLLKQWILKITAYADRLIDGLKTVDYPSRIADQQVNWIGKSEGAEITWQVTDHGGMATGVELVTFTTRKDTIPGVTFIVIAPESPLVDQVTTEDHKATVHAYRKQAEGKTDIARQESKDKSGVPTGMYAKNPFNGELVPIYVADYVLAGYGTGVVMGMGGHDERDREFSLEHNLPVILTTEVPEGYDDLKSAKIWKGEGRQINTGEGFDGLSNKEAGQKIFDKLVAEGKAVARTNYKLRDWVFSRQHYWGEPIPVIHCDEHGAVPVPEDQLPVELPPVEQYEPTDTGESPLAAIADWVNTSCPVCGKPAKRETDTMPNWAGSSWYYLRYFDARNSEAFAAKDKLDYWQDVDLYLGGMEHTTLHLLYSRFWHQFLFDQGLVPTPEPYAARRGQGIILAADGTKMSKSKGNVINPTEVIDSGYGADALRVAIAFIAPYDQTTPWSPEGVAGTYRFLQRVWTLVQEYEKANVEGAAAAGQNAKVESSNKKLLKATNHTVKKVSADLQNMSFNTAIAALMEMTNELHKIKAADKYATPEWRSSLETLLRLLAPFAPHIAEELWQQLGHKDSIHVSEWPKHDEQHLVEDTVTVVVQINGKLRAQLPVSIDALQEDIVAQAQKEPNVQVHLEGKEVVKTIFVPGKLVNFVVK
jgi:leucyl-tRNA synthetase